jgi:hypothetical protein
MTFMESGITPYLPQSNVTLNKWRPLTYFRWYARGIGLVKETYQRGETINEKILTEYHLAQ